MSSDPPDVPTSSGSRSAAEQTRSLRRVRQIREFASDPLTVAEVDAIVDAARWSGSSRNIQPWRFIVLREAETLRRLAEIGSPQTRPLATAVAAIALAVPVDPADAVWVAYDEGRATERILIAATELGLGAGITWIRPDLQPVVAGFLGLPDDRKVRTIVAIGHPSEAARRPKSARGTARLPRDEVVFLERLSAGRG